jgi:uncharacterized protein (TIGR00369 family)
VSFNQVLGFRVVSLDPEQPRARFEMRPELVGHYSYGQLHGGVTAAVLDAMAGYALTLALAEKHCDEPASVAVGRFSRIGTIDLRIDYLRRGIGKWFEAGARVTRLGGRIGSVQMTLHSDTGALVATGSGRIRDRLTAPTTDPTGRPRLCTGPRIAQNRCICTLPTTPAAPAC